MHSANLLHEFILKCCRYGPGVSLYSNVIYLLCRFHSTSYTLSVFIHLCIIYSDMRNHLLWIVRCTAACGHGIVHRFHKTSYIHIRCLCSVTCVSYILIWGITFYGLFVVRLHVGMG